MKFFFFLPLPENIAIFAHKYMLWVGLYFFWLCFVGCKVDLREVSYDGHKGGMGVGSVGKLE